MSAPEIAQLKGGSMNSPLTKRRRAKNSPFHRAVMPEDREGMGLGKRHGGSDSRASYGCSALLPPTGPGLPAPPHHPSGVTSSCRSTLCSQAVPTWKVLCGWSTPAYPSVTANTH